MNYIPYFYFFLAAAAFGLALTPLAIRLAHRFGFLDHPGHRKIHEKAVPHLGGIAVLASVLAALFSGTFLFRSHLLSVLQPEDMAKLAVILVATLLAALLGLADDCCDLKPRWKFLFQFLISGAFAVFCYHFQYLHFPGFPVWNLSLWGIPLTIFWMMAVINGFNFMDGVDGLAGIVTAVSLAGLGIASFVLQGFSAEILSLAMLGALLVFLAFNWSPAKIYMGNAGSNALGAFMAASLVSLGQFQGPTAFFPVPSQAVDSEPFRFQLLVATLLLGYPALEVLLSASRRGIRRFLYSRSMEWSEKEHLHHRLLNLGLETPSICWISAFFNALLVAAGLLAMVYQNALAVMCAGPVVIVLALVMPRLGFFDFLDLKKIFHFQPHYQVAHNFTAMQRAKLGLAVSQEEVLALVNQTCFEFGVQGYRILVPSDAEGKGNCHVSWERSLEDNREYLSHIKAEILAGGYNQFKDHVGLESGKGVADWYFEPHVEEAELDVEYRVLVNAFMREALDKLASLKPSPASALESHATRLSRIRVTSTLLRRRHRARHLKESVKNDLPIPPKNPDIN